MDICSGCSLQLVEGSGVVKRQRTAVVHSCQNHVDKQCLTSLSVGSIPAQAKLFFSVWTFLSMFFFSVITIDRAFALTLA